MLPGTLFLLHINTNNNVVFCVLLSKLEHIAHYKAKQQTKHIKKTKKIAQASGHTNHTRAHTHTHTLHFLLTPSGVSWFSAVPGTWFDESVLGLAIAISPALMFLAAKCYKPES